MIRDGRILNAPLLEALTAVGHTQAIVIGDAGLPIPRGVARIDLSLTPGVPSFDTVVRAVLQVGVFESATVASEAGPRPWQDLADVLGELPMERIPHVEFKARLPDAHLIVRTGEMTPYRNIALIAGTTF